MDASGGADGAHSVDDLMSSVLGFRKDGVHDGMAEESSSADAVSHEVGGD